jgi:hypothetical protein
MDRRLLFWTAGPTTAQELARRLIILIFAGWNRRDMIRRELPRTKRAGWVRKPFRIEREPERLECQRFPASAAESLTRCRCTPNCWNRIDILSIQTIDWTPNEFHFTLEL